MPLSLLLLSLDCFKSDIMLHAKAQGKKLIKSASEVDVKVFVLPHSYLACKMYQHRNFRYFRWYNECSFSENTVIFSRLESDIVYSYRASIREEKTKAILSFVDFISMQSNPREIRVLLAVFFSHRREII